MSLLGQLQTQKCRIEHLYHKGICLMLRFLTIITADISLVLKICFQTHIKLKIDQHFLSKMKNNYKMKAM
jgi:hypothetical protein